jgi:hypothetical protein
MNTMKFGKRRAEEQKKLFPSITHFLAAAAAAQQNADDSHTEFGSFYFDVCVVKKYFSILIKVLLGI